MLSSIVSAALICLFIIPTEINFSNAKKIGECPSGGPWDDYYKRGCNITCFADEHCEGNQKCCADGCSRICKDPELNKLLKPGFCPPPDINKSPWDRLKQTYMIFKVDCIEDNNCKGNQKCCLDLNMYSTGLTCRTPVTAQQSLVLIDRWLDIARKNNPNLSIYWQQNAKNSSDTDRYPPPRKPETDRQTVPNQIVPKNLTFSQSNKTMSARYPRPPKKSATDRQAVPKQIVPKNRTVSNTMSNNKPISVGPKPIGGNSSKNYNKPGKKSRLFPYNERDYQTGNFNDTQLSDDQYDGDVDAEYNGSMDDEEESETDNDQEYLDPQKYKNPMNTGTKAGECPIRPDLGVKLCEVTCSADHDCPDEQKCCQYGCRTACFYPRQQMDKEN